MDSGAVIVGAGPVGLCMAIELARFGVGIRVVDKAAERTNQSKALVIWSRPLELLERAGCSARLIDAGFPVDSVNIIANHGPIARFQMEGIDTKYPYGLMIPQSETERILGEFLNGLGVRVERGVEMTGCIAEKDKVITTLRHADGGVETVETSWLIGCDGAHSKVRHQLGMEFRGDTMPIDWILADVHLENMPQSLEINIVWHADGVLAIFPMGGPRYRMIADTGTARKGAEPSPDPTLVQVQEVLDRRLPGVQASHPVWLSSFRINERKVDDYRSGRVFLAGDAAHVHSPAGGQGMNTGMQDACNLAWKLALVERRLAGEKLLDSYTAERGPIAEQVLKVTGRVTSLATMTGEFTQFLRNHTAALVLGLAPVQRFAARAASEISIGYPRSPLNAPHAHREPKPGSRAPIRAAEPLVGAGDTPRFALAGAPGGMPAGLMTRYSQVLEPALHQPYHPDGLWLVRPDGYVAVAAKAADWQAITQYLEALAIGAA